MLAALMHAILSEGRAALFWNGIVVTDSGRTLTRSMATRSLYRSRPNQIRIDN
jgi:hypothetical protein